MSVQTMKDRSLLRTRCLIGGEWVDADDGSTSAVLDPASGAEVARVPCVGAAQVDRAIEAAVQAFAGWRRVPARERARLLRRWYDLIVENVDDLAIILTAEQGKPLAEARAEIVANAAYLEWFAEEGKRAYGDIVPSLAGHQRVLVLKQPVGVCAAITPWNFPNGMITRKVGPALAAGCTMLLKPASQTPLSALALAELAVRAGLPRGVFSVLTGPAQGIGAALCTDHRVAKLSFTGSTRVGRLLLGLGAESVKKMTLELGGNAPFIVFDDADVELAVQQAMIAKFRNAGQTCVCANRFFVHRSVHDAFVAGLAREAAALRVGPGNEPGTQMGPLIDARAVDAVCELVDDAVAQGAEVLTGGHRHALGGHFYEPTVLTRAHAGMRLAREEIFGPVAPVFSFDSEAEVLALANDTEYGLAGYFFTRDLARAWRVAEALETGIVGINSGLIANEAAPFGGIKHSGHGREGSRHGLDDYLDLKYVCMSGLQAA